MCFRWCLLKPYKSWFTTVHQIKHYFHTWQMYLPHGWQLIYQISCLQMEEYARTGQDVSSAYDAEDMRAYREQVAMLTSQLETSYRDIEKMKRDHDKEVGDFKFFTKPSIVSLSERFFNHALSDQDSTAIQCQKFLPGIVERIFLNLKQFEKNLPNHWWLFIENFFYYWTSVVKNKIDQTF